MAKSLMDGMEQIGAKSDSGGGKSVDGAKIAKLAIASVMLIAAAVLLAFNFGLIGQEKAPAPTSDEASRIQQEAEEAIREEEKLLEEQPRLERAGSG